MNEAIRPYTILQHAFPFVMLDRVYDLEFGVRGKGFKRITPDEFLCRIDTFPRTFILEAAAQLSGIVSGREEGGVFAGMKDISFTRDVRAGDTLELSSVVKGTFGGLYSFSVNAVCEGETVMEGEIYLALA